MGEEKYEYVSILVKQGQLRIKTNHLLSYLAYYLVIFSNLIRIFKRVSIIEYEKDIKQYPILISFSINHAVELKLFLKN